MLQLERITKHNFYIASPFFDHTTMMQVKAIELLLEKHGKTYFSPRKDTYIPPNASMEDRQKAFDDNVKGIEQADFIIVNTSSNLKGMIDPGTIFEAGHAYASGVPIVYVCFNLPKGAQFNLMLAQSGINVCTSLEELEDFIENGTEKEYIGDIE